MFGFGKDKKKEEEEKAEQAKQDQISQAMRNMSDQLAAKGKEIANLEDQLDDAKQDAADKAKAERELAAAKAELAKMKAEAQRAQAVSAAKAQIEAQAAANRAKQGAPKVEASPAPGAVLGGASTSTPAAAAPAGMLGAGVQAWVRNAGGKNLRLRDKPGLESNAFAGLPPGTQMTILEGPIQDDGYPWWRVRVSDGREGWVAGTELLTQPE